MRLSLARLVSWMLLFALLVASPAPRLLAGDDEEDDAPKAPKCTCDKRNACWHYLNAPVAPPNDPCWCRVCTSDHPHAGKTPIEGWNAECFARKSLDCFLRRHAASWRITCFDCL